MYRARHDLLTATLTRDFAGHVELVPLAAGLHVAAVARDPSLERIRAVVRRAWEKEVAVQELARFTVDGAPRAGLVLGYGAVPTSRMAEGLQRLRECFENR